MNASVVRLRSQAKDGVSDDSHHHAALLSPAVGCERATEIAAKLLDKVDLLHIAKEDAAYFEHLGIEPATIATLTAAFELSAFMVERRIAGHPCSRTQGASRGFSSSAIGFAIRKYPVLCFSIVVAGSSLLKSFFEGRVPPPAS